MPVNLTPVNLTDLIFTDEEAARRHFEAILWPRGPECPHCGVIGEATELQGKSTRPGVYKCRSCEKPFTATIGTVYERSHIPLHKWLLATHLLCASKKGISALQLWRMLGFGSYRTAWFMAHRIREGMREALPEGAEFDFRYNHRMSIGIDDETRATAAVKGIAGKRLTYRQPHRSPNA
jgi:transposase-like protein